MSILVCVTAVAVVEAQQATDAVGRHAPRVARVPYAMSQLGHGYGGGGHSAVVYNMQNPNGQAQSTESLDRQKSPPAQGAQIPVWHEPREGTIELNSQDGRVSLLVRNAPLNQVLSMLAQEQKVNLVCAEDVSAQISIVLNDVTLEHAVSAVLATAGYTSTLRNDILHVTSLSAGKNVAPDVQGRQVEVFPLDYVAGTDVDQTIKGLLSSVGQSFLTEGSSENLKKPKDIIVVEDVPPYLDRIRRYVQQVDRPPRQVLIEVHVLEVELEDKQRHGVNFKHVAKLLNKTLEFEIAGAANPDATPAFFARLNGGNLEALVECLKSTTDAKTLASPSVLVVDGQQAKIQIGEQLGYRVTTTTETSTMESVDFLDVGVVLTVTPHISGNHRVLLQVQPKVSSGRINPETELPEEQTKQVETNALLDNREGMVIGGLIQETDGNIQSKIPALGDLWLVGSLFQKRQVEKKRSEIIVALVPRVLPYTSTEKANDTFEFQRCQTPLFTGPLERTCRPWAPALPDCKENPAGLGSGQRKPCTHASREAEIISSDSWLPEGRRERELDEMMPETFGHPENSEHRPDAPLPSNQYQQDQNVEPGPFEEDAGELPTPSDMGAEAKVMDTTAAGAPAGWLTGARQPVTDTDTAFRAQSAMNCGECANFGCGSSMSSWQQHHRFAGWITTRAFSANADSRQAIPHVLPPAPKPAFRFQKFPDNGKPARFCHGAVLATSDTASQR